MRNQLSRVFTNEAFRNAINRHCVDISSVHLYGFRRQRLNQFNLIFPHEVEEIVDTVKDDREGDKEYIQESDTESHYHTPSPVIPKY